MESKRQRRDQWRARIEETRWLIEELSPAILRDANDDRTRSVPDGWRQLVAGMKEAVSEKTSQPTASGGHDNDERRAAAWAGNIYDVGDMIRFLFAAVRKDLGFDGEQTLPSMVLVEKALTQLYFELKEASLPDGRGDGDEARFRVFGALRALSSHFDGIDLQRTRALAVGEAGARFTSLPTDAELDESVEQLKRFEPLSDAEEEKHREFQRVDRPVLNGVLVRSWLAEVDPRFGGLDPLVVMEEFAEAHSKARGGKNEGGDGRIGPPRSVARLALMCGALGAVQHADEDFDHAVDRVRAGLLTARSRIRAAIKNFPGQAPPATGTAAETRI